MGLVLRAEKLGVLDLLPQPLRREDFLRALHRLRSAAGEVPVPLPEVAPHGIDPYVLVGQSPAMVEVYNVIAGVAGSPACVVSEGESGPGKEVVARAIHLNGSVASGPFVAVNCAAIPENLLESELFGHEKGSFTGAVARRVGRFEQASGGTLFLDEIADMGLALQAKILRAVQEREIERVGGTAPIPVNVRLIAATNRDLREAVAQGRLREDLYYRLAVVIIQLPRLTERGDDLLQLIAYFVSLFAEKCGKRIEAISDPAFETLRNRPRGGNGRGPAGRTGTGAVAGHRGAGSAARAAPGRVAPRRASEVVQLGTLPDGRKAGSAAGRAAGGDEPGAGGGAGACGRVVRRVRRSAGVPAAGGRRRRHCGAGARRGARGGGRPLGSGQGLVRGRAAACPAPPRPSA